MGRLCSIYENLEKCNDQKAKETFAVTASLVDFPLKLPAIGQGVVEAATACCPRLRSRRQVIYLAI